jgi:uncharacterized protein YkwD
MEKLRIALALGVVVLTGCASMDPPAPPATAVMSGPTLRTGPADTPLAAAPSGALPAGGSVASACDNAAFQQALVRQLNAVRSSTQMCRETPQPATRPVRWNPALAAAATSHSADMARRPHLFGHRGSDGSLVDQRVRRYGYQPLAAGESIAGGDYNAESLVNTWLGNERHCRTLMNPAYTEVGASCVSRPGTDFGTYWTMVMGNRAEPVRAVAPPATPTRARPQAAAPKAKAASPVRASKSTAGKPRAAIRQPAVR